MPRPLWLENSPPANKTIHKIFEKLRQNYVKNDNYGIDTWVTFKSETNPKIWFEFTGNLLNVAYFEVGMPKKNPKNPFVDTGYLRLKEWESNVFATFWVEEQSIENVVQWVEAYLLNNLNFNEDSLLIRGEFTGTMLDQNCRLDLTNNDFFIIEGDSDEVERNDNTLAPISRPKENTVSAIVKYINHVFDGFNYYIQMQQDDTRGVASKYLLEELEWIESKAKELKSAALFCIVAEKYRSFATTHRHASKGEDKETPLKQSINCLKSAMLLEPNNIEYKITFASFLFGIPQVRNIALARQTLESIPNYEAHPIASSIMEQIKLQNGELVLPNLIKYGEICLSPVSELFSKRNICREMIRQVKRGKSAQDISTVLEHLYRCALITEAAEFCHFCSYKDPILSKKYYAALRKITKNMNKFTYKLCGKVKPHIDRVPYLSPNDYKSFELIFGKTDVEFTLIDEIIKTH